MTVTMSNTISRILTENHLLLSGNTPSTAPVLTFAGLCHTSPYRAGCGGNLGKASLSTHQHQQAASCSHAGSGGYLLHTVRRYSIHLNHVLCFPFCLSNSRICASSMGVSVSTPTALASCTIKSTSALISSVLNVCDPLSIT